MKAFVEKTLFFLFVIILTCVIIIIFDMFVVGSVYERTYVASILDKIERLKSLRVPKIILIGNSNAAYGFNSELLEKKTGFAVVNLGLHGGLGNAFHENMSKLNMQEGDIVIICHSSFSDDDKIVQRDLAWVCLDDHFDLLKILRKKDYFPMIKAYPNYLKRKYLYWLSTSDTSRSYFNQYGDITVRPEEFRMNSDDYFIKNEINFPKIDDVCTVRLNEFYDYCEEKGARLLVAGYPVAYGKYSKFNKEQLVSFKEDLQSKLKAPVISDYRDYCYPYELFFDTNLHLTEHGARIRTEQLVKDLNNFFAEKGIVSNNDLNG